MTISRARLILLACASGFLYPLSFPAFDLGFVAWFALVPLHIAVEYVSPRRAFRVGWLAGTLAFTGAMFWVITAMNVYGKVPFPIATLAPACEQAFKFDHDLGRTGVEDRPEFKRHV